MSEISKARIRIFKRKCKAIASKVIDDDVLLAVFTCAFIAISFGSFIVCGIRVAEIHHHVPNEQSMIQ